MSPTGTLHRRVLSQMHSGNPAFQIAAISGVLALPADLPTEQLYGAAHETSALGTRLALSRELRRPSPIVATGSNLDRFSTIEYILHHPCWSVDLHQGTSWCWLYLRATEIPHDDPSQAYYLAFGVSAVRSDLVGEHEALIDLVDGWSPGPHPSGAAISTGRSIAQVLQSAFFLRDGERYGLVTTFATDAYRELEAIHAALNVAPADRTPEQEGLIQRNSKTRWTILADIIESRRKDPEFDFFCRNRRVRLPLNQFASAADLQSVEADSRRALVASRDRASPRQ